MRQRLLRLSWWTRFVVVVVVVIVVVVVFAPLAFAFGRSHHGLCKRLLVTSAMPSASVAASRRRSPRLRGLAASSAEGDSEPRASESTSASTSRGSPNPRPKRARSKTPTEKAKPRAKKATRTRTTKTAAAEKPSEPSGGAPGPTRLPRTAERDLLDEKANRVRFVLGVDEAGRGPLAGPVVAAAAIVPADLDGITDSKKLTRECRREALYEEIVNSENVRWAVAVMDAPFIDRVNILQATLRGMAAAASALVMVGGETIALGGNDGSTKNGGKNGGDNKTERIPIVSDASIERKGCYVVRSPGHRDDNTKEAMATATAASGTAEDYYALIDGNKVPPDMPCPSHSIVKGDGREYSIAAASILAKVTRDRLMRGYHELWPHYGLDKHKGYPTADHVRAVREHGASPIHRRTFRPLRDMTFDENGRIVEEG